MPTPNSDILEPVDFTSEAEQLAAQPKQEYISEDQLGAEPGQNFTTDEEYEQQAQEERAASSMGDKYQKGAKIAFQTTDMLVPRLAAMFMEDVSHKELQADPADHEDIIQAYAAVLEYYDYDFDNPVAALILILTMVYGVPIADKSGFFKRGPKKRPTRRQAPERVEVVDAEEVHDDDDDEDVQEYTEDGIPIKNHGVEKMQVVADLPSCEAPNCGKLLKKGQKRFCSNKCRVNELNANNKN